MNKVLHQLKLTQKALQHAQEHLSALQAAIAVAQDPDINIDVDIIVIPGTCDYGGTDANYFIPEEERGSDGS
jgi:hypothetical protein